jgi:hypothetical protein
MTKVKTLEYRILRKIREKLRNYLTGKSQATSDIAIENVFKESKDLIRKFKIPQTLDYYMDICVTAFNFIS